MDHEELVLRLLDDLKETMGRGFSGVHNRLDTLNGRTRLNEVSIAALNERTASSVRSQVKGVAVTGGAAAGVLALLDGLWRYWGGK